MTLPRPLPPHGTHGRAVGRPQKQIPGCRCEPCRAELRRYSKRRNLLNSTGRPLTIDATPAALHIKALLERGATMRGIADAAPCSYTTIVHLVNGQTDLWRSTSLKILAVQLDAVLSPLRMVPAVGSVRRVRALMVIGHSSVSIGDAIGSHQTYVRKLASGGMTELQARTAERIAAAYKRLVLLPGLAVQTRRRALALEWHGPMAWDTSIDDPTAVPDLGDPQEPVPTRIEAIRHRTEEINRLLSFGVPTVDIAQRVGVRESYVRDHASAKRSPGWRQRQTAAA